MSPIKRRAWLIFIGALAALIMPALLLAVLEQSATATSNDRLKMDALVVALTAWIIAKTGLITPDSPHIVFVSRDKMIEMTEGTMKPLALYSAADRTVYLRDDWTPDELANKGILLHELVHHILKANRAPMKCEAAEEADAYHLQLEWLVEQGVKDPYAFLDTNEFAIILRSMCRD